MSVTRLNRTVGFIGLGTMGRHMATNLVKAGFDVCGFDVVPGAAAALRSQGVVPAASVADAARDAHIVITMLPDTADVEMVVRGEAGLLAHPSAGRLIVDMSTIAPAAVRDLHRRSAEKGIAFLDAPVSGGPGGAENATLSIMVGGDADATDHVPHPAARVVAYLCFAVVLVAVAAGIGVIVAHGLGMRLVMDGLVPTFVAK